MPIPHGRARSRQIRRARILFEIAQSAGALFDHGSADNAQNDERDDARIRLDDIADEAAQKKAQDRHKPLEQAERYRQNEQPRPRCAAIAKRIRYRYRERVHSQGDAQKNDFRYAH